MSCVSRLVVATAVLSYRGDGDGVFVYQAGKESEGVRFSPVK